MSSAARRELAISVAARYRSASKQEKSRILNEFASSTGYHRKYAITVLCNVDLLPSPIKPPRTTMGSRRRKYGPDVEKALWSLWEASGCACPKLMMPGAHSLIDAYERHGEPLVNPYIKDKLLQMSPATAERILSRLRRQKARGISTTKPGTVLRDQIPIRKFHGWADAEPGFFEIDTVAHCGGTAAGDYAYSLTMTDVCTTWTENVAVPNRSRIAVVDGIDIIRRRLPFLLRGVDSDNGSEFINYHLKGYCDDHEIDFTRCQPYKKNDQCYVEQKNGAVVRPLVGYARYEGASAVDHLNRLYRANRLFLNFFKPTRKLISKTRDGARMIKKYDAPKTPYERLLDALGLTEAEKEQRRAKEFLPLNPAKLLRDIADLQMGLRHFAVDDPAPMRNVTVERGSEYGAAA